MYWTYSKVTYCFGIPILQRFMGFAALSYKRDWSYSPWHQRQNGKIVSLYVLYVSWMEVSSMSITVIRWCQFEVLHVTTAVLGPHLAPCFCYTKSQVCGQDWTTGESAIKTGCHQHMISSPVNRGKRRIPMFLKWPQVWKHMGPLNFTKSSNLRQLLTSTANYANMKRAKNPIQLDRNQTGSNWNWTFSQVAE